METLDQLLIEWGVATSILGGQKESGDQHLVQAFRSGVLVAAVDGLGHGHEASAAAKIALATLERYPHESVTSLLDRCHHNLLSTRGVVMSLASFDTLAGTMTWLGVGSVQGILRRADPSAKPASKSLLVRGGIVGGKIGPPYPSVVPVARDDTLVFTTDGIRSGFDLGLIRPDHSPQEIANRILARYAKETDDALVLVARYKGSSA